MDATFDDLLPLALARMPKPLGKLVTNVVRNYLNLNVADLLCRYNGPILLIRRTLDEIISVEDFEMKAMINRGDYLLKSILLHRYPNIVTAETLPLLNKWLRSSRHERGSILLSYKNSINCQFFHFDYQKENNALQSYHKVINQSINRSILHHNVLSSFKKKKKNLIFKKKLFFKNIFFFK